jgi:ABC-type sugar transport system substrate-binding protein
MGFKRLISAAAALVVVAFVVSACGSSNSSSSSSTAATSSSSSSSFKAVPAPTEIQPTAIIAGLTPLTKAPPKGLKIVTLQCNYPTCAGYTKVFETWAKDLGWENKTITFKTGEPQGAMSQAVDTPGVEYINISGVPTSIIKPQLKIAAEKKILVMKGEDPGPVEPPTVPAAVSRAIGNSEIPAKELARWMINDSKGTADAVVIGLPEIPTVGPTPPTIKKTFESECSGCKSEELAVTGEELAAGTVPAKVVSYLQSHSGVNYVAAAFGNLALGVPQAIKTAGLAEKVKVVSMNGIGPAESAALAKGEIAAFFAGGQGEGYAAGWVDAIARSAEKLPLLQSVYEKMPQGWLCTPKTAKECTDWEGVSGYIEKYLELWGVKK